MRNAGAPRPTSASLREVRPSSAIRARHDVPLIHPERCCNSQSMSPRQIMESTSPRQANRPAECPMALVVSLCGPVPGIVQNTCTLVLRFAVMDEIFATPEGQQLRASAKQSAKELCHDFIGLHAPEHCAEITFDQLTLLQSILSRRVGEWSPKLQLCAGQREEKSSWEKNYSGMRTICLEELDLQAPDVEKLSLQTPRPASETPRSVGPEEKPCQCANSSSKLYGALEMLSQLLQGLQESLNKYQECRNAVEGALGHQCEILARASIEREQALIEIMEESTHWASVPIEEIHSMEASPRFISCDAQSAAESAVVAELIEHLGEDEIELMGYATLRHKSAVPSGTSAVSTSPATMQRLGSNTEQLMKHAMALLKHALHERDCLLDSTALATIIADGAPTEAAARGVRPASRDRQSPGVSNRGRPTSGQNHARRNSGSQGHRDRSGRSVDTHGSPTPRGPPKATPRGIERGTSSDYNVNPAGYVTSVVKQALASWASPTNEEGYEAPMYKATSQKLYSIRSNFDATVAKCKRVPDMATIIATCEHLESKIARESWPNDDGPRAKQSRATRRSAEPQSCEFHAMVSDHEDEDLTMEALLEAEVLDEIFSFPPELCSASGTLLHLEQPTRDAIPPEGSTCTLADLLPTSYRDARVPEDDAPRQRNSRRKVQRNLEPVQPSDIEDDAPPKPLRRKVQRNLEPVQPSAIEEQQSVQPAPPPEVPALRPLPTEAPAVICPSSVKPPTGSPRLARVVTDGHVHVMPRPPTTPRQESVRPQRSGRQIPKEKKQEKSDHSGAPPSSSHEEHRSQSKRAALSRDPVNEDQRAPSKRSSVRSSQEEEHEPGSAPAAPADIGNEEARPQSKRSSRQTSADEVSAMLCDAMQLSASVEQEFGGALPADVPHEEARPKIKRTGREPSKEKGHKKAASSDSSTSVAADSPLAQWLWPGSPAVPAVNEYESEGTRPDSKRGSRQVAQKEVLKEESAAVQAYHQYQEASRQSKRGSPQKAPEHVPQKSEETHACPSDIQPAETRVQMKIEKFHEKLGLPGPLDTPPKELRPDSRTGPRQGPVAVEKIQEKLVLSRAGPSGTMHEDSRPQSRASDREMAIDKFQKKLDVQSGPARRSDRRERYEAPPRTKRSVTPHPGANMADEDSAIHILQQELGLVTTLPEAAEAISFLEQELISVKSEDEAWSYCRQGPRPQSKQGTSRGSASGDGQVLQNFPRPDSRQTMSGAEKQEQELSPYVRQAVDQLISNAPKDWPRPHGKNKLSTSPGPCPPIKTTSRCKSKQGSPRVSFDLVAHEDDDDCDIPLWEPDAEISDTPSITSECALQMARETVALAKQGAMQAETSQREGKRTPRRPRDLGKLQFAS